MRRADGDLFILQLPWVKSFYREWRNLSLCERFFKTNEIFFWDNFKRLLTVQFYRVIKILYPLSQLLGDVRDLAGKLWKFVYVLYLNIGKKFHWLILFMLSTLWSHGVQVSTLERITTWNSYKTLPKLIARCSSWLNRNPIIVGGNGLNWACLKNGQHLTQEIFMLPLFKNWCFWFLYVLNF